MRKKKVFISYKRSVSSDRADLIETKLKESGYEVFLDRENFDTGDLEKIIKPKIENCDYFIFLAGQGTLEACINNPDDWVRKELIYAKNALDSNHIIPVIDAGYKIPDLPDDIDYIKRCNGVIYSIDYKEASFNKIIKMIKENADNNVLSNNKKDSNKNSNMPVYVYFLAGILFLAGVLFAAGRLQIADKINLIGSGNNYKYIEASKKYLEYKKNVDEDGIIITKYTGYDDCIELPDELAGFPVKEIGNSAFSERNIKAVKLPESLDVIDESAFYKCSFLEYVDFNKNLKVIEDHAFNSCVSLSEIELPDSLKHIGYSAFRNTGLNDVILPKELSSMGICAFVDDTELNFKEFKVSKDNKSYTTEDGVLFNKDKSKIIAVPCAYSGKYDVNPSVKTIGNAAFYGCTNITEINLNEDLQEIEEWGLSKTGISKIDIGANVKTIGNAAFAYNYDLKNIKSDEKNTNYKALGNILYTSDNKLHTCYAGNGNIYIYLKIKEISGYAFSNCKGLNNLIFTEEVTSVAENAFSDIEMQNIYFYGNNVKLADNAVNEKTTVHYCIPLRSADIEYKKDTGNNIIITRYKGSSSDLAVPNFISVDNQVKMVKSIGEGAFKDNKNIKTVMIKNTIKTIEKQAFSDCSNLSFLILCTGVESIGFNSFASCNLDSVLLPASLKNIAGSSFFNKGIFMNYYLSSNNTNLKEYKGVLFSNDMKTLIAYPSGKSGDYKIPDTVENIGEYAFAGAFNLTNITFDDNLKSIGFGAFWNCTGLKELKFPDGLETIKEIAFYGCSSVVNTGKIPDKCVIGKDAFKFVTN